MATVKVKLRPSSVEGEAGVIYYQISHNHKRQQISTQHRVYQSDWDAREQELSQTAPNRALIQNSINRDIALLRRVTFDLDCSGIFYSVNDIVHRYKFANNQVFILDYMSDLIEQLQATDRLGTAKNYQKVMRSFGQFLGGCNLPLSALTEQVVEGYNAYLIQRGLVRNSISFYMRILRAVYNKAVRQHLIPQEQPFADVYTGIDHTRKRAVSESVISSLNRLSLPPNSPLELVRDMFIFSYCTRGMAFVDMAYLKRSDLREGAICYSRHKTGQPLTIKIEPCIGRIIARYARPNSPYIFPIITASHPTEAYEQYRSALNTHNRLLGKLSAMVGCGCRLTSYTSRHSWATAARDHNVPISVISAGMGHTTEQTTRIYLASLENSIIDDANRGIISLLG